MAFLKKLWRKAKETEHWGLILILMRELFVIAVINTIALFSLKVNPSALWELMSIEIHKCYLLWPHNFQNDYILWSNWRQDKLLKSSHLIFKISKQRDTAWWKKDFKKHNVKKKFEAIRKHYIIVWLVVYILIDGMQNNNLSRNQCHLRLSKWGKIFCFAKQLQ